MGDATTGTDRNICIVSQRKNRHKFANCSIYEFEDVIQSLETADVFTPRLKSLEHWQHRTRRFLSQRTGLFEKFPSGASSPKVDKHYDIFGCFLQMPVELMSVDAIGDWRSRCDMAFCVVEEVWHRTIDQYEPLIKSLSKFDLIVCCFAETCERLAEVTGKPVIHVPYGVDALRFLPDRGEFDRPIDIHYMGRRRPELHDALLAHARDTGRFYHYDTFTSLPVTTDHNAHRDHLANLVRRSKLFMVDYAKKGHADQKTGEMMGWGPRHIEGMMGGAVQVGYTPDTADYLENFDWPTVVSRLPEDADEAVKVISDLLSDPAKLTEMRLQNYAHVGRRHDWLQRWRQITEFFGLPDTPAMAEREAKIDATTARLTRRASDQVVSIGSIGGAKR